MVSRPLGLWGPEGNVQCKVKFDVADVAYPVVSLGKMIETGFTFSFDDNECYMHKGNRRVEIFRKGRVFCVTNEAQVAEEHGSHDRAHRRGRDARSSRRRDGNGGRQGAHRMMGQEQQLEHGWTNPGTTHHHHDHGRFDRVRCDQERKPHDNTT